MKKRVVITGMGAITPIGNTINEYWTNLINGKNGIDKITHFDTSEFNIKLAAESNIDLSNHFTSKELNKLDRFSSFSLIAADEAIAQSGINSNNLNKDRIGVIIGSGIGGMRTLEKQHLRMLEHPKKVSPYFIPSMITDIASGHISIKHGFKGINYSLVSACATSSHCIGNAFRSIQYNDAEIVVVGGSESSITPLAISGFANMKALTKQTDIDLACRPYDLHRDGFVMGEGAGILILESLESALDRDAHIIAEICGYGATADAYHLTSPSPDGQGAISSMDLALKDANLNYDKIDYINTHGTSTILNDKIETKAIKTIFKKHAYNVSISSTKSMTGHLLGAAGAIESIASILTIKESIVPPTINYKHKDPDCDLNYTPNNNIHKKCNYTLSNTFGFGGHNASLIFKKYK